MGMGIGMGEWVMVMITVMGESGFSTSHVPAAAGVARNGRGGCIDITQKMQNFQITQHENIIFPITVVLVLLELESDDAGYCQLLARSLTRG
eukprot:scaffold322316_cov48-Tisochrysis_lutea.AAC.1